MCRRHIRVLFRSRERFDLISTAMYESFIVRKRISIVPGFNLFRVHACFQSGDRIIEVDGVDLRHSTHERAVEVIQAAGNPVSLLVQSLVNLVRSRSILMLPLCSVFSNLEVCPPVSSTSLRKFLERRSSYRPKRIFIFHRTVIYSFHYV